MAPSPTLSLIFCFVLVLSASADLGLHSPVGYLHLRRRTGPQPPHALTSRSWAKRQASGCSGTCATVDAIQLRGVDIDIDCTNETTQHIYACHMCRYPDVTLERMQKVLDDWVNMCTGLAMPVDRVVVSFSTTSTNPATTSRTSTTSSRPTSTPPPTSSPTSPAPAPTASTSPSSASTSGTGDGEPPSTAPTTSAGYPDTAGPPADPKLEALLGAGPPTDEKGGAATNSASRAHCWLDSAGFALGTFEIGLVWTLFVGLCTFLRNACL